MAESVADPFELKEHNTDIFTYESHLKGHEGLYFARTKNDKILTLQDVAVWAKELDYTVNVENLIRDADILFRTIVHLLRDGYGVNLGGLVELYLNVGGFFKKPADTPDPKENPVSIHVRRLHGAARAVEGIHVVNWGLAPTAPRIDGITDNATGTVNDVVTPEKPFTITGKDIRILGENKPGDRIGVSFYAPGSPNVTVYVSDALVINEANRIVGVVPELIAGKSWQIKIRTKFSGSGTPLKETREIVSGFSVQVATTRKTDEATGDVVAGDTAS